MSTTTNNARQIDKAAQRELNKAVRAALEGHCDSISVKGDVWTVRQGFFLTYGNTHEGFAKRITTILQDNKFMGSWVDSGEVWKPFRGGAPVAKQSHWWFKFTVTGIQQ